MKNNKERPTLHSTQPSNPDDPQYPPTTFMPTPAHPNARFMPKWVALCLLILFFSIFGILFVKDLIRNEPQQPSQSNIPSSQPTTNQDDIVRLNVDVVFPKGWTKTIELTKFPVEEERQYELLVLTKGEYKLRIGIIATGLGSCNFYDEKEFVQLHNKNIADFVIRQKPIKENQTLSVCRKMDDGRLQADAPFGIIDYDLPKVWDEKILKEMDAIVESLQLARIKT